MDWIGWGPARPIDGVDRWPADGSGESGGGGGMGNGVARPMASNADDEIGSKDSQLRQQRWRWSRPLPPSRPHHPLEGRVRVCPLEATAALI